MKISVVIPIYNEEENLALLYEELTGVMQSLDCSYELLFVDDGSTDMSLTILHSLQATDSRVVVVQFRRNFGQTAAMSAGFDYSSGDVIITMDGDLQNDPRDIPRFIGKIEEGFDVVCVLHGDSLCYA